MKAFLQAFDEKVQLAVEVGWKEPSDPPATQDDGKIKAANFNSRVLNALFSDVTNEECQVLRLQELNVLKLQFVYVGKS